VRANPAIVRSRPGAPYPAKVVHSPTASNKVGCWAHYPESGVIQHHMRKAQTGRDGDGLDGARTPDKTSQIIEKREKPWRGPPASGGLRAKTGPLPKGFKDVALHLKVSADVPTRGGDRSVTEIVTNY
jgi:hypothetical protein